MSRSYRKTPIVKDGRTPGPKWAKRKANKKVRHMSNLPSGKAYKKANESWDIHDFAYRWPWAEAKREWEEEDSIFDRKRYPTLKSFYRHWRTCMKK